MTAAASTPSANAPEQNAPASGIQLDKVTLRVQDRVLLRETSATLPAGKFTLIVGCSGVGKSLLLNALAGLADTNDAVSLTGMITIGESRRQRANVGVVFQHYALFDELTPLENIRFAHAHGSCPDETDRTSPDDLLEELQIPKDVPTAALSGGQRQRLAVARTLAYNSDVILYDEPTTGLDLDAARNVAALLHRVHESRDKTSVVVTHDIDVFREYADAVFVLDPQSQSLREVPRSEWDELAAQLMPAPAIDSQDHRPSGIRTFGSRIADLLEATSRVAESIVTAPVRLLPLWKSPWWGFRYLLHYLGMVAGPSAWLYIAITGAIIGFVTTYFTFRYLPYTHYTKPLLIEELLGSMGFALYRIFVPVLTTILIAARCGGAVASDVGGKRYGRQIDALRTFGVPPNRYLQTGILIAFLVGTPLLVAIGYVTAAVASLIVFAATHADRGADFWYLHFHRELMEPGQWWFDGTGWMIAKVTACAVAIALVAYHRGTTQKRSTDDVSNGITSTILWATLAVLTIHFLFAFFEFEAIR